jgi:hypothetical protein
MQFYYCFILFRFINGYFFELRNQLPHKLFYLKLFVDFMIMQYYMVIIGHLFIYHFLKIKLEIKLEL